MAIHSKKLLAVACALTLAAAIILLPTRFTVELRGVLRYSATVLIPAVFPFAVLSHFLCECGFVDDVGRLCGRPFHAVFGLDGRCAGIFALSLVCGSPVGASVAATLYRKNQLSATDFERISAMTTNLAPAYLMSGVGRAMYGDVGIGVAIYLGQIMSAVMFGLATRPQRVGRYSTIRCVGGDFKLTPAIRSAVTLGGQTMLTVVATTLAFALMTTMLGDTLKPLFEVTYGLYNSTIPPKLAAGYCGFGGLATLVQTSAILATEGVGCRRVVAAKVLSAIVCALSVCVFVTIN